MTAPRTAAAAYLGALAVRAEQERTDAPAAVKLLRDLAAHVDAGEETEASCIEVLDAYCTRRVAVFGDDAVRLYVRDLFFEAIEGLSALVDMAA